MKDGESYLMSAARESRGGSGTNQCAIHDQMTHDHERRMEELKGADDKAFECIADITKHCEQARKECQAAVWASMEKKPKTATLLSIVGIALTIAVIVFALYSSKINSSLETLHATDIEVKGALATDKKSSEASREAMAEKIQDIYIMVIQLGGTPPKRLREGAEK
jgi:hypothetical protein